MTEKVSSSIRVPLYQMGKSDKHFAQHLRMPVYRVDIEGVGSVLSSYVKVDSTFNIFALCGGDEDIRKLKIEEVAYVDSGDNILFHKVTEHDPIEIRRDGLFRFGMVSKMDGLRWGTTFEVDGVTGHAVIKIDRESPIIGVKFSLVA
ncbi:hypothetical protein [Pseudomonas aeruginosa]|uniref:hypothetical protein n=1 Tax=Pseudomonas aeruginosa TaxID=287 RepID=UPI0010C5508B|nr:hypothetical protein [Pseudomonas aeruginosa]MBW6072667.1 hypothetical protein [Pseudomonas aeruginosa]QBX32488.1 hypothetical protein [Pseudomonas phage PA1C]BEG72575.1 hypothetical protein RVBP21_2030 [Pseudomonas phage BRkr]